METPISGENRIPGMRSWVGAALPWEVRAPEITDEEG